MVDNNISSNIKQSDNDGFNIGKPYTKPRATGMNSDVFTTYKNRREVPLYNDALLGNEMSKESQPKKDSSYRNAKETVTNNMNSVMNEEVSSRGSGAHGAGDNDLDKEFSKVLIWTEEEQDAITAQNISVKVDTDKEEEVDPDAGLDNYDDDEEEEEDDAITDEETDDDSMNQDTPSVIAYKESVKGVEHYWYLADSNYNPEKREKWPKYISPDDTYQARIKPKSTTEILREKRLMALNEKDPNVDYPRYMPPKTLDINQNESKRANMKLPYSKPRKDALPTWL